MPNHRPTTEPANRPWGRYLPMWFPWSGRLGRRSHDRRLGHMGRKVDTITGDKNENARATPSQIIVPIPGTRNIDHVEETSAHSPSS
jgi:hypothetical protein